MIRLHSLRMQARTEFVVRRIHGKSRSFYYKLTKNDDRYDYYLGEYSAAIQPQSGSYGSGLDVKSTMNGGTMLKHGPYTTPGTTSKSVDLTYTIGLDGASYSIGSSWSYTMSDLVVKNYTSVVDNILDIDHDIDESTNVGKTTCVVEPGKLIRINQSSDYAGVDTYKAQFCHKGIIGFKDYNDNEQSYAVVFSAS